MLSPCTPVRRTLASNSNSKDIRFISDAVFLRTYYYTLFLTSRSKTVGCVAENTNLWSTWSHKYAARTITNCCVSHTPATTNVDRQYLIVVSLTPPSTNVDQDSLVCCLIQTSFSLVQCDDAHERWRLRFLATKFTIVSKRQAEASIYAVSLFLEHTHVLVPVPLPCSSDHKRTGTFPCVELPASTMGT